MLLNSGDHHSTSARWLTGSRNAGGHSASAPWRPRTTRRSENSAKLRRSKTTVCESTRHESGLRRSERLSGLSEVLSKLNGGSTLPSDGFESVPKRMNEVIGYARVSTGGQDLGLQLDALQAAGVNRVFSDVGSGSLRSRPQLDACLERLGTGDTLIVWRLDRLGRSLRHLLTVLAELSERGVAFRSLTEAIDTATAAGRLQVHLFAALAEFERSLGQERTRAGLEAARARGRTGGRPVVVTSRKLAAALAMRAQGDLTMTQIADELGVSPASLYRRLARHRQETEVVGSATT
jgi:DNA invertase Pin-like site-specific DNA recombinase